MLNRGELCRGSSICHSRLEGRDIVHCHSLLLGYLRQKLTFLVREGKRDIWLYIMYATVLSSTTNHQATRGPCPSKLRHHALQSNDITPFKATTYFIMQRTFVWTSYCTAQAAPKRQKEELELRCPHCTWSGGIGEARANSSSAPAAFSEYPAKLLLAVDLSGASQVSTKIRRMFSIFYPWLYAIVDRCPVPSSNVCVAYARGF